MIFKHKNLLALTAFAFTLSSCKTASYQSIHDPVAETPVSTLPQDLPVEAAPASTTVTKDKPSATTPSLETFVDLTKVQKFSEVFVQEGVVGNADILIVIDDSDSMREEQDNLSSKLNDLLTAVKDSNWQIGVITTSVQRKNNADVCALTLIKPTDSNIELRFKRAVSAGTKGSDVEEGIRQAVNGLRCTETPWVRPNSTVAVLIVSDEDNCSDGTSCNDHPGKSHRYLIDYVEKDLGRTVGVNAGFFGIFSPPASSCASALHDASIYQLLVNYKSEDKMNYGKICDASYKDTLQRISKNISVLLVNKFNLKETPDTGSLVVTGMKANGQVIASDDYVLSGNVLSFKTGSEPALKSSIEVSYKVTKK